MAYIVDNDFREKLYSGESNFRATLIINGNTIPNDQIASISISSPIIDDSKQVFYLGSFISQKITIKFKNMNGINVESGQEVSLSIGQYVNNAWVDVPIGLFLIDDLAVDYYEKCEFSCLDYAVKFKPNIDYSPCFTDGKANVRTILEYICEKVGVELGDCPTINDEIEVGTYDSTVSGKQWVSYIAEIKGCNAKIDRTGKLTLQPLKQPSNVPINALESASFETGDSLKITKVTFFDAIRNFTFGDDTNDTLFIRQDNPFVTNEDVVNNIYHTICTEQYSETGKSFDIDDADANSIDIKTIYGETSQEKLSGKNLFAFGITAIDKTTTYRPTSNQRLVITATDNVNEVKFEYTSGNYNRGYFEIDGIDGTLNYSISFKIKQNTTSFTPIALIDTTNSTNTKLVFYISGQNGTTSGLTGQYFILNDIMLELGSTATTYEQYCGGVPSPNPDYPQDIHNVSGDNDIIICGKNILSANIEQGSWSTTTGEKISGSTLYRSDNYIIVSPSTTYKYSIDETSYAINVLEYDANKTYLGQLTGGAIPINTSFTTSSNTKYITIFRGQSSGNAKWQIEKGTTITPYEAYQSYIMPIDLPVENLFDKDTRNWYRNNGSAFISEDNTSTTRIRTDAFAIKGNKTYTLSGIPSGISLLVVSEYNTYGGTRTNYISSSGTFTLSQDTTYIALIFGGSNFTDATNTLMKNANIQLEQGSKANTYTPYGLVPIGYNLFDKNDYNILNAYISSNKVIISNPDDKTIYIPCKSNTTYTISKMVSNPTSNNKFRVTTTSDVPTINTTGIDYVGYNTGTTVTTITITTSATAKYLCVYIMMENSSVETTLQEMLNSIRIEEGTISHANDHDIKLNNINNYKDKIFRNSGKNLFDKDNADIINGYVNYQTGVFTAQNSNNQKCLVIGVKPNTKYTWSGYITTSTLGYGLFTTIPNVNDASNSYGRISATKTITTGANDNYLVMFHSAINASVDFTQFQVEEGETATTYEPYGNGDWYWNKNTNYKTFDGSENWITNPSQGYYRYYLTLPDVTSLTSRQKIISNYYNYQSSGHQVGVGFAYNKSIYLYPSQDITISSDFKNWLSTHNTDVIYRLDIPTYEKITYQPLIDQLNAYAELFEGVNHIVIEANDLTPTIDIDYYKNSNFELTSIKTHNYGDFTLDAWDNIDYDLDGTHYITLNNNTIKYEMSIMGDVDAKIPTKQQQVTTNVIGGDDKTNIKIIKTNVDQLNATVDIISKQQTATETNISQLQLDVNGINTEVERIENVEINGQNGIVSQLASVQQTVNNISNMFQITGGINLIRNSAFLLTDDLWTFTDNGTNPYHTELGNSYNSALSGDTVSVAEIKLRSIDVKSKSENITDLKTDGTRYTFNFYHKQDNNMTTTIKMYSTEDNTVKAFDDIVITGQQPKTNYSVSFIPTFANYTLEIVVTSTASIGYAYIYDMMLNSGETQSWQPASDEIYSTTLSMSRLGLKVYSVGDGTITLLGSDGLLTYETTDGRTLGRLVSSRTVEGDTTRNITTQALYLTRDITIENPDKWVSTIVTINGSPHKVEYIDRGGQ